MPRVPVYERQQGTAAMPQPRVAPAPGPDALGGPVAQGLGQLGQAVGGTVTSIAGAMQKEKTEAELFRLDQADLEFETESGEVLRNSETGFLNQLGVKALNDKPALERLAKKRDDILKGLPSDELRQRWQMRADHKLVQTRVQMESHVDQQRKKAFSDIADGRAAKAMELAALNAHKPDVVAAAIQDVLITPDGAPGPLRRALAAYGVPPDKIDVEEKAFVARAWATSIKTLVKTNPDAAAQLVADKKTDLGVQFDEVREIVEAAQRDKQGDAVSTAAVTSHMDGTGRVNEAAARAEIAAIEDVKLKDEATKRLEYKLNQAKDSRQAKYHHIYNQGLSQFQARGRTTTAIDAEIKTTLQRDEPELWEKLVSIERSAQAGIINAPPTVQQIRAFGAFLIDANKNPAKYSTPQAIDRFNAEVLPQLAYSDWDKASAVIATLQGQANKPEENMGPLVDRALISAGRKAGIFPMKSDTKEWGDEQFTIYYRAQQELRDKSTAYKQANGKDAPLDVVEGWVKDQMMTVLDPKSGITIPKIGVTFGQTKAARIEADKKGMQYVPEADLPAIKEGLKAAGLPETPENILKAYRAKQGAGGDINLEDAPGEVRRSVKGRQAIYDAKTQKFLRWVDGKQ